jgi:hypothetical protein
MPANINHPTERTLRRFLWGATSPAENRAIVAHLLRQCERCSRVLAALGAMAGLELHQQVLGDELRRQGADKR